MQTTVYINSHSGIVNKPALRKFFSDLKEGAYTLTLTEKNKRTHDQNDYYWGVIIPIALKGLKDLGYSDVRNIMDAHKTLKSLFLKQVIRNNKGEFIEVVNDSRTLTKAEFTEYIERIAQWAAEYLNVEIPAPNSQTKIF
jgi:uncharacterized protein YllA (UPF0747 family)